MPVGITTAVVGALGTAGVGAATADIVGGIVGPALFGAGLGAGGSALLGKSPGKGALFGGLTGGFLGGAGELGASLGLSGLEQGGLDVAAGAGAGALDAGITGGNVGKSALFGGVTGGAAALLGPAAGGDAQGPSGAAPSAAGAAGGGQAAATAVGAGGIPDLTAPALSAPGAISVADLGGPAGGAAAAGAGGIDTLNVVGSPAVTSATSLGTGPLAGGAALGGLAQEATDASKGLGSDASVITPSQINAIGNTNFPAAGGAKATGTSFGNFVANPSLGTAGKVLTSNPGTVLGALGIGVEALTQPSVPGATALSNDLKTQADTLGNQSAQLESYINSGTLPPGAMAAINTAAASAKATLKSRYAAMGLTGSTSEATALAQVDQQVAGQIFDQANSLLQTGIKESGVSADIYKALLGQANEQSQQMQSAISNFAAAIAGGGNRSGVNINLGGGATT